MKCSNFQESSVSSSFAGIFLLILVSHSLVISTEGRPATNKAILTVNSFEKGGDGGGPSECDGKYHSDNTLIVALSTRWYNKGSRCHKFITIHGNGRSVRAKVVDECDSTRGCRKDIVDGSKAVWKALGVSKNSNNFGFMKVTWSDA